MELKSNNAPSVRDLVATVLFSMMNGVTRFRHVDRLLGEAGAWLAAPDGWQCAERTVRLQSWSRDRRLVFARRPVEEMQKRRKDPPVRKFTQLGIPGIELAETNDSLYADGYEWHALVTDFDLPARDVLPLHRGRGDCENIFDEMKNQWGWSGFTAHSLGQTALFAGLAVIAANLWNIFTWLGEDGSHREAATSRPLLQSCIVRLSRHARSGIVTICTSPCAKAAPIYRAITFVLSRIASASQLRWFQNYGFSLAQSPQSSQSCQFI